MKFLKKYKITFNYRSQRFFKGMLFVVLVASSLALVLATNQANAVGLLFKRVVFEGGKRAEVLTVLNGSQEVKTYRLGWTHFKMTEDKALTPVPAAELPPGVAASKDLIRFSPRRFTLGPGDTQQVRMVLRTPAGLSEGEYRSHLSIRPEGKVARRKARTAQSKKSGVEMEMLTGMSIPVIVRQGNLSVDVAVDSLIARSTGSSMNVDFMLKRAGGRSVYGDVDFICNEGLRSEYLLKFIRGYAIYSEVSQRKESHVIRRKPGAPSCTTLTIRYTEMTGRGEDVGDVLAKATATVQ